MLSRLIHLTVASLATFTAIGAWAQTPSQAPLQQVDPTVQADPYSQSVPYGETIMVRPVAVRPAPEDGFGRVVPFYGSGSLSTDGAADRTGNSRSFGLWFDFGSSYLTWQTGFSLDDNNIDVPGRGNVEFDTWGVPLMLRINFSGQPQSTVYFKTGFNFVDERSQAFDYIDTVGVVGLGGNIPLGTKQTALVLEADYSSLLTRQSFSSNLDGLKIYAGISLRMF